MWWWSVGSCLSPRSWIETRRRGAKIKGGHFGRPSGLRTGNRRLDGSWRRLDAWLAARLRFQHLLHAAIVVAFRRRDHLRQLLAFDDQLDLVRVEHFALE